MARQTVIEILYPEFRAYAHALCGDPDEAEDLIQDAVERALRTSGRPKRAEALRPWMFRVIRNLHYDALRKRRIRQKFVAAEQPLLAASDCPADPARDIMIRRAFGKLRPEVREILVLVDIMGLKYAEAAAVLDVPPGTVMSRISRARRALLELIDDERNANGQTMAGR